MPCQPEWQQHVLLTCPIAVRVAEANAKGEVGRVPPVVAHEHRSAVWSHCSNKHKQNSNNENNNNETNKNSKQIKHATHDKNTSCGFAFGKMKGWVWESCLWVRACVLTSVCDV